MTDDPKPIWALLCAAQRAHLLRRALGLEHRHALCDYHEFDDVHLFYERDNPAEFIEVPDDELVLNASRNR